MKNIHIIPTDKPSRLYKSKITQDVFISDNRSQHGDATYNVNIYITSDEEIKFDEYYLGDDDNIYCLVSSVNRNGKKIILTTDQELIKDNVQKIDDKFLEWFVQNPSCEEVEVEREMYMPQSNGKISDGKITHELSLDPSQNTLPYYKIIIPKEPKLINNCPKCGLDLIIREHYTPICTDIDCRGIILSNETLREWASKKESKQETLEEAMESYLDSPTPHSYKRAVKFGAKWQQERMYSEEDMINFAFDTYCYISELMGVEFNKISENKLHAMYNFEQFKKK